MVVPNKSGKPLSPKDLNRLDQIVERFEKAWHHRPPPVIEEYLPAEGVDQHALLNELVHADLECRLKAGEPTRAEDYLSRFPELVDDNEKALALIVAEYNLRQRLEPELKVEEYLQRFPQFRQDLPHRLPQRHHREEHHPSHFRCPNCQQPIRLDDPHSQQSVTCSSCGSSFGLEGQPVPQWSGGELPKLGSFQLLQEVGQGAFGAVYRARDTKLDRIVAVKVPRGGRLITPLEADRFIREARNAAQLVHPGIVPVYEVGQHENLPFIVSAFVTGTTLAEAMNRRRLGFREVAELMVQVAESLDYAHTHGVIHRDLKPSNIMVGRAEDADAAPALSTAVGDRTYVMDFGLARRIEGEITLTFDGQILGTPAYMSPEQARGESHDVDGRSDIYSLGVILYEMMTGELPFRGVARMVLQQILSDEPRQPRRLNDRIPRDLETITMKCLAKEPGRRYQSAGELATDLHHFLAGEPIRARPVGNLERAWRWAIRNPKVAGLTASVIFLLLTLAIGSAVAVVLIDQKRVEAVTASHEAAKAQKESEQSAELAKYRLDRTEETLSKIIHEMHDKLKGKPALHQLKETLLNNAVALYETVVRSTDPSRPDRNMVHAHQRLGDLYIITGKTPEAAKNYETAFALADQLARADPQDPKAKRDLYLAYGKLAQVTLRKGDAVRARELFGKSLELARDLAAAPSANKESLHDLVYTFNELGKIDQLAKKPEAAGHFQKALEYAKKVEASDPDSYQTLTSLINTYDCLGKFYLEQKVTDRAAYYYPLSLKLKKDLAARDPDNINIKISLANTLADLGQVHKNGGDFSKALEFYGQAVKEAEILLEVDPNNTDIRKTLLGSYAMKAEVFRYLGEYQNSFDNYRKTLEQLRAAADADPQNVPNQTSLAFGYANMAGFAMQNHEFAEATRNYEQALKILEQLHANGKFRNQVDYENKRQVLQKRLQTSKDVVQAIDDMDFALSPQHPVEVACELMCYRASFLASRGEHARVAETAKRLRAFAPKRENTLYDVACCYSFCISGLMQDKKPDQLTPEESALKARYAKLAVEALNEAVNLGYKDLPHIRTDHDLSWIRQEESFKALVQRLEAKTALPKKPPGN